VRIHSVLGSTDVPTGIGLTFFLLGLCGGRSLIERCMRAEDAQELLVDPDEIRELHT